MTGCLSSSLLLLRHPEATEANADSPSSNSSKLLVILSANNNTNTFNCSGFSCLAASSFFLFSFGDVFLIGEKKKSVGRLIFRGAIFNPEICVCVPPLLELLPGWQTSYSSEASPKLGSSPFW